MFYIISRCARGGPRLTRRRRPFVSKNENCKKYNIYGKSKIIIIIKRRRNKESFSEERRRTQNVFSELISETEKQLVFDNARIIIIIYYQAMSMESKEKINGY